MGIARVAQGAFIDQMAVILGVEVGELDQLAARSTKIYPIASRCGVFCQDGYPEPGGQERESGGYCGLHFPCSGRADGGYLAHGCDIKAPVLFCGGPLTFMPTLRKAFKDYLSLKDEDIVLPANGTQLPALGTALYEVPAGQEKRCGLSELLALLRTDPVSGGKGEARGLPPVFKGRDGVSGLADAHGGTFRSQGLFAERTAGCLSGY